MRIIVDTNIVFSALLSPDNHYKALLSSSKYEFFSCNFLITEIFKNSEKMKAVSKLDQDELLIQFQFVFSKVNFLSERLVPSQYINQAFLLCKDIDPGDTLFVALTVFLGGKLLTGDKILNNGLRSKDFHDVITIKDCKSEEI